MKFKVRDLHFVPNLLSSQRLPLVPAGVHAALQLCLKASVIQAAFHNDATLILSSVSFKGMSDIS